MTFRTDALLSLSAAALLCGSVAFAQTTAPGLLGGPTAAPMTSPQTATSTPPAATPAPAKSEPFVGVITGDKVYIRPGPGSAYYEMGQLNRGDLVQVTGASADGAWDRILPPNGTFCMIAKEFVQPEPSGHTGTLKADYVHVRAGTALYPNRDPSAVLTTLRKGATLTILGSTDKYYEIAPPEGAEVYTSAQFVRPAPAGTAYKVPQLWLPAGVTGPAKNTVSAPTTSPNMNAPTPQPNTGAATPANPRDRDTVVIGPPEHENTPTENSAATAGQPTTPQTAGQENRTIVVPPQPATQFAPTAYSRFADLNTRYQAELQKPVAKRDLDGLIKDYDALAATADLPPSVKTGTAARLDALHKLQAIQHLATEQDTSSDALAAQRKALEEKYAAAQQAVKDYQETGPYLSQGVLQTSKAVPGKYALVNPATGRVVAYVSPRADVDIGALVGKYVGVRGVTTTAPGTDVTVIQVKTATLLPRPTAPGSSASE